MEREDGKVTIKGLVVNFYLPPKTSISTPEDIAWNNLQLGKYNDGKGECHVGICCECYIDGLFHIWNK